MQIQEVKWSKSEFMAYVLFYAAQADFQESTAEKTLIHSKVSDDVYERMHAEIDRDNDYQRIQKIDLYVKSNNFSEQQIDDLIAEIHELFVSDDSYGVIEQSMELSLRKILK